MKVSLTKIVTASIPYCINFETSGSVQKCLNSKRGFGNSTILIREFIENNPNIVKSAEYSLKLQKQGNILKSSIVCFLHYQISKKYDNAEDFLNKVLIGDNISQDSIIFILRMQLLASRMKTFTLVEPVIIKRTIAAYNYFNSGVKLTDFRQAISRITSESIVFIK